MGMNPGVAALIAVGVAVIGLLFFSGNGKK